MKPSDSAPSVLAYDIRFRDVLCGTSWARLHPGREPVIECMQRMNAIPAIGLRRSTKRSIHHFSVQGRPEGGWIEDSFGNRVDYGPSDSADFVLESNMFPLTAYLLKLFSWREGGHFQALLPETGETVAYTLTATPGGLESSLGERIKLDDEGFIQRISFPTAEFSVQRCSRRVPTWRLSHAAAQSRYQIPPDLNVEDVVVDGVAATCVRPPHPMAVAVFVGGTGVYDRHGFTAGLDLGYHRLLDDLARLGIASIRYEKLGPSCTTLAEAEERQDFDTLGQGAARWLDWIERQEWRPGLPKLVIGHSMGGIIALALAVRRRDIDGVILLGTPGRPFRSILAEQTNWLHAQLGLSSQSTTDAKALHQALLTALEQDAPWTEDRVDSRLLPWRRKHRLYRSLLDLDPTELVHSGSCPLLIVQGGKDVQVSPDDARTLRDAAHSARRDAQLIEPPHLDHLLKRNTADGLRALAAYADRRRKVPVKLLRKIADWARRLRPTPDSSPSI